MKLDRSQVDEAIRIFGWYPFGQYLMRALSRGDEAWLFRNREELLGESGLTDAERRLCEKRMQEESGGPIVFFRAVGKATEQARILLGIPTQTPSGYYDAHGNYRSSGNLGSEKESRH